MMAPMTTPGSRFSILAEEGAQGCLERIGQDNPEDQVMFRDLWEVDPHTAAPALGRGVDVVGSEVHGRGDTCLNYRRKDGGPGTSSTSADSRSKQDPASSGKEPLAPNA